MGGNGGLERQGDVGVLLKSDNSSRHLIIKDLTKSTVYGSEV